MTRNELNNLYFDWMYQLVSNDERYSGRLSYRKLLGLLHDTEFTYTMETDGNRYEDGVNLRYRFGYKNRVGSAVIADYLDDRPCSVLEMMIALSIRLEEHIMGDPDVGDRTGQWFWDMIVNLGLGLMDDAGFYKDKALKNIRRFLDRNYERNGKGGLFTVDRCRYDLREIEIWYQACWHLNEVK